MMSSSTLTGVAGLSEMPALAPASWMPMTTRCACVAASQWKVTMSAPARAYSSAVSSGLVIMRCTSAGRPELAFTALTTLGPNVRLGTKWPSMTSTCTKSALEMASRSRARLAMSAERMDGAILTSSIMGYFPSVVVVPIP